MQSFVAQREKEIAKNVDNTSIDENVCVLALEMRRLHMCVGGVWLENCFFRLLSRRGPITKLATSRPRRARFKRSKPLHRNKICQR